MPKLGAISEHLTLVRRMAQATGTDLAGALQDGGLTSADWADMVTNCRGCACADSCRAHLSMTEITGRPTAAPDYCENRATFARLGGQPA